MVVWLKPCKSRSSPGALFQTKTPALCGGFCLGQCSCHGLVLDVALMQQVIAGALSRQHLCINHRANRYGPQTARCGTTALSSQSQNRQPGWTVALSAIPDVELPDVRTQPPEPYGAAAPDFTGVRRPSASRWAFSASTLNWRRRCSHNSSELGSTEGVGALISASAA